MIMLQALAWEASRANNVNNVEVFPRCIVSRAGAIQNPSLGRKMEAIPIKINQLYEY